ncbi:MAG: hypothetical protein ABIJ82_00945 [Patescibacteria group bacterium]
MTEITKSEEIRRIKLPSSGIIRTRVLKIIKTFDDVIQMELVKVRWEEIKRLRISVTVRYNSFVNGRTI